MAECKRSRGTPRGRLIVHLHPHLNGPGAVREHEPYSGLIVELTITARLLLTVALGRRYTSALIFMSLLILPDACGSAILEALCYRAGGRGFEDRSDI
jgi:hypothetical protein